MISPAVGLMNSETSVCSRFVKTEAVAETPRCAVESLVTACMAS